MQSIFLFFLGWVARLIIKIHKPYIIGITGTVGKTTISSHIAKFLIHTYGISNVSISPYRYNGEFGLPLSIIWAGSGWRNPFLWIAIFARGIIRCFWRYPKYLILEYGIDHPGEMQFLRSIAVPDIAIITPVNPNHLEQFGTLEVYRGEKLLLLKGVKQSIIYEWLRQFIDQDALFYSMGWMSDIDAAHMHMTVWWVSADISLKKHIYHIHIPAFWAYQIENVLPVYGIADILGIDPASIAECAWTFIPEPGRSSILRGTWESVIIDGSYNGGLESLCRGIDSVIPFSTTHRILYFLWDMRELGSQSQKIHRDFAHYVLDHVDTHHDVLFFLVGPMMREHVFPLLSKRFRTWHALSSRALWETIQDMLTSDPAKQTIVYVKWSQNTIFLEEGIKKFLLNQQDAGFLCRQSTGWMRKKDVFFSEQESSDAKIHT